jgi:hypothetical protein
MQVVILPAHHDLQNVVQLEQGSIAWRQNTSPDGREGVIQSDFDLIDTGGLFCHINP